LVQIILEVYALAQFNKAFLFSKVLHTKDDVYEQTHKLCANFNLASAGYAPFDYLMIFKQRRSHIYLQSAY